MRVQNSGVAGGQELQNLDEASRFTLPVLQF
jgi:hypothetical protein